MKNAWIDDVAEYSNIVLLGEAGCGKSEIAVNLSLSLLAKKKPVHLFDLDMTKALFRSRDEKESLEKEGVHFHYEEQFADAPTVTGGVVSQLKNEDCYTVLDVGGDYIGARSIGCYASYLNRKDTVVYYIINPYRPWSLTANNAASVMYEVLSVSHIKSEQIKFIANPNYGEETSLNDVLEGYKKLCDIVDKEAISCLCVRKEIADKAKTKLSINIFPISRYLEYPWK